MFHTCDHCENPATINVTKVVNGKASESFYCEDCAPAGMPGQSLSPIKEVAKLLKEGDPVAAGMVLRRGAEARAVCPECGMTFTEFRKGGRLGCAHDYEAFGEAMSGLLHSIHKADTYTGKTPGGNGEIDRGRVVDELSRARDRLRELVVDERYEEAANLRDEILRLETGPPDEPSPSPQDPPGAGDDPTA